MRLSSFLIVTILAALAGCGKATPATYTFTPPETPGGRMCIAQCGEAREYCNQGCDLDQRQCVRDVQTGALQDYDKYTREQFATHQEIELRPRDFERLTPCDNAKAACMSDCQSHYASCYKNCGGAIDKTGGCQFLCF